MNLTAEFPQNLIEFDQRFATEEACREYLFNSRWPKGWECPRCKFTGPYWGLTTRDIMICPGCEYQCSLRVGTAFEKSKRPLKDWFKAIYFITEHSKQSVSALGMKKFMGFGKIGTAWSWLHKLRAYMSQDREPPLHTAVEVDEAFFGGRLEGGTSMEKKVIVFVVVERRGRKTGRVRAYVIPDRKGETLQEVVRRSVVPGALIAGDNYNGYYKLVNDGYTLDLRTCYERGMPIKAKGGKAMSVVHITKVNRIISLIKRLLLTTHQGSFSEKHLQSQLDEYVFRFDRRDPMKGKPAIPMLRFQELFSRLVEGPSLKYWEIVGRSSPTKSLKPQAERPWHRFGNLLNLHLETS